MTKSEIGEIWQCSYYPSEFKIWISPKHQDIRRKIEGWKKSVRCATYYYPNGAVTWDFIIPTKLYDRVAKLMGVPKRRKNPGRVAGGKKTNNLKPLEKVQK